MRKESFFIYIVVFGLFSYAACFADPVSKQSLDNNSNLKFSIVRDDVLDSLGVIYAIEQDRLGFLWLAGEKGLLRWDGYIFKRYTHDPQNIRSLNKSNTHDILIDRDGLMWVVTGEGLARYNSDTDDFTRFSHDDELEDKQWLSVNWQIIEANDGTFYIASESGLINFNKKTEQYTYYREDESKINTVSDRLTVSVCEDRKNRIWLGTRNDGLDVFDPITKSFKHYNHDPSDKTSISHDGIVDIHKSQDGSIWVGTKNGLNRFDENKGIFQRFYHEVGNSKSLPHNAISNIYQDRQNRLFIATEKGLALYNPNTMTFVTFDQRNGLTNEKVRSVFEDKSGDLWFGHYPGGLSRLDIYASAFTNYRKNKSSSSLSHDEVLSMAVRGDEIWVGTENGLNKINTRNNEVSHFLHVPGDPQSLPASAVLSVLVDHRGVIWTGTWRGGLSKLDETDNTFETYNPENSGLRGSEVWSLMEGGDGSIWVGTEKGLNQFVRGRGVIQQYYYTDESELSLFDGPVMKIFRDSRKQIWLGGYWGVSKFEKESEKFTHYRPSKNSKNSLSHVHIFNIYEDVDGYMWFATENGLDRFDIVKESFSKFNEDNGLSNNATAGVLQDNSGAIWVSTARGISRVEPKSLKIRKFTLENGLPGNVYKRPAAIKLRNGKLTFGGTKGVVIFDPANVKENGFKPPVVITDFLVYNKSILPNIDKKSTGIQKTIWEAEKVELHERQSVFTIVFSALNFNLPEKNQFAYRLLGFDDDWNHVGNNRRTTYTNLPAGNYIFEVKASNNDGIWNEVPKRLTIRINPYWWKTWWAYIIYIVLVLGVISLIFFAVWQRKRAEDELKVSEKLKQIDKIKDSFLENTSHELRTPLNGIVGLSESLIAGATGELSEVTKDNLRLIVNSGRRLSCLINDILDFSKLREHTISLSRQNVDLYTLVEIVLGLSQPLVGTKSLKLINSIEKDMAPVLADENRLQQVMYNLVGNAIKFTDEGAVTVRARTINGQLWVEVADTGIGIPEEKISSIFNAFEQVGDDARGGTGLGLAVTKQLIELHGGAINVSSVVGEGTSFRFSLSLSDQLLKDESKQKYVERELPSYSQIDQVIKAEVNADIDAFHILVVDDELVNCQVLINILSLEKYRVSICQSGHEALDLLSQNERIDLILLDVMMPGISGYETCKIIRLKYDSSHMPVVFLTAKNQVVDMDTAFKVGGNDFLTKPIIKEELLARVKTHLDLLKINRSLEQIVEERTEELRESHEGLKRSQSQLVQSEKMSSLGVLVAGVGHELNNPSQIASLAAIQLEEELDTLGNTIFDLLDGKVDEEEISKMAEGFEAVCKPVNSIKNGVERIGAVVNNLRTFSRVDEKEMRPERLSTGLISTLNLVKVNYKTEVDFVVDIKAKDYVLCVPSEINQVFMNLMVNACQAMLTKEKQFDEYYGKLDIRMYREGGFLIVTFSDTGPGMPPDVRSNIFDPFFTTKPSGEGTGLGLSISYDIIKRHNGEISVESTLGEGTEFKLTFPIFEEGEV